MGIFSNWRRKRHGEKSTPSASAPVSKAPPAQSKEIDLARAVEWTAKSHATSSKLNLQHWLDNLATPDISVKWYGSPDHHGREEMEPIFAGFFSRLNGIEHEPLNTDYVAPRIYQRSRAHYSLKAGDKGTEVVSVDIMGVYHVREVDGELRCFRMEIWGDPGTLFQKLEEYGAA